jgi:hypothetical protein
MGKGQITGTTWMVDLGTYKNTEKKQCKSDGIYKEDAHN